MSQTPAKFDQPQRQQGIPPTMRVSVELTYVRTCPDCRRIVGDLALNCINDPTVTGFRLVPGKRHAHEVTEGATALPGLADATTGMPEAGDEEFEEEEQAISDRNGFHPDLVVTSKLPNGFDAEVR